IADSPGAGSVTSTLFTVTFPVLVTRYEYVIVVPTASKVVGLADFTSVISGLATAETVVDDSSSTSVPSGAVPVAVPVLLIEPRSTSACVVVYVAVHVTLASGASGPAGHVTDERPGARSVTSTACNVTLPVFVTTYEYVMSVPAASKVEGAALFSTSIE